MQHPLGLVRYTVTAVDISTWCFVTTEYSATLESTPCVCTERRTFDHVTPSEPPDVCHVSAHVIVLASVFFVLHLCRPSTRPLNLLPHLKPCCQRHIWPILTASNFKSNRRRDTRQSVSRTLARTRYRRDRISPFFGHPVFFSYVLYLLLPLISWSPLDERLFLLSLDCRASPYNYVPFPFPPSLALYSRLAYLYLGPLVWPRLRGPHLIHAMLSPSLSPSFHLCAVTPRPSSRPLRTLQLCH